MAEPSYLKDYIEVHDRIVSFYERYPEGSLRCKEWSIVEADGKTFFVYVAQALRSPDDQAPAEGIAWEPVPGQTPYTKLSEAMVCETSAWGRALAALGFEVKRGIASREEVMNRSDVDGGGELDGPSISGHNPAAVNTDRVGFVSEKQKAFWHRLLKSAGLDSNQNEAVTRYAETIPTDRVSKAMDGLNTESEREETVTALLRLSDEFRLKQSDLPYDATQ